MRLGLLERFQGFLKIINTYFCLVGICHQLIQPVAQSRDSRYRKRVRIFQQGGGHLIECLCEKVRGRYLLGFDCDVGTHQGYLNLPGSRLAEYE